MPEHDLLQTLTDKLRALPEAKQLEALDFIEFLTQRSASPAVMPESSARRKASGWLVDYVGDQVGPGAGVLVHDAGQSIWRFEAFITSLQHAPWGPIGQVDVDAHTGVILTHSSTAEEMIAHGAQLVSTLSSSTS